jgi:hypothetical protein
MADQTQENLLPDPETAYQNLFDGVHQRVFFHKMASYGYVPQSPHQAALWLQMAGKLRAADQEFAVKQAEDALDPFEAANAALDRQLVQSGFKMAHDEEAISVKQAAEAWMEDPTIYNSVLALKAAEAEYIAQQLQQQG